MNTSLLSVNRATMSSREIAELTQKHHRHVKRDIEIMFSALEKDAPSFGHIYLDSMNREQTEYLLDRELTEILITGYSIPLRAKVIRRLHELESGQAHVPKTFADALRLAADQQEKIAQLALENQQQAEKIDVLESMLANGVSAPEFCRHLNGVNTQAVNRWLKDKGWLFESGGQYCSWRVSSYARDKYMTERAIELSSSQGPFSVSKPVLLRKGARWLIHQYMQGRLPMKKTWDGVFKHDMTGVLEVAV